MKLSSRIGSRIQQDKRISRSATRRGWEYDALKGEKKKEPETWDGILLHSLVSSEMGMQKEKTLKNRSALIKNNEQTNEADH